MATALRIILIIIIAWYLIRFINRYIVPALFGDPGQKKPTRGTDEKQFRKSTSQGDVTITDYGRPAKKENPDKKWNKKP
jgi:hypothetical protein